MAWNGLPTSGGDLAPSFGGREIFRGPRFLNDVFFRKIFDDHFLVIAQVFLIFHFFSQIFPFFTMLNVVYDPFLTRKATISEKNSFMTPFFTLFVLSRESENTTSQNIGGTDAWAVPPPQILGGDRPPSPPRSPPLLPTTLRQLPVGHSFLSKTLERLVSLQLLPYIEQ